MFIRYFILVCLNLIHLSGFAWSPPLTISGLGFNFNPIGKVNTNGEAIVVWSNGSPPNYTIQASIFDGLGWSAPETISGSGSPIDAHVTINSAGNIVALWKLFDTNASSIITIQKPSIAGAWGTPEQLSTSLSNGFPNISINESGQAIAGWVNFTDDTIEIATLTFGGSWSPISVISSSGGNKVNLKVGIDTNGNGVAVWEESDTNSVAAAQFISGVWSTPAFISTGLSSNSSASLNKSSTNAVASWTSLDTGEILASTFESGIWSTPATVSPGISDFSQSINLGSDYFISWLNVDTGIMQAIRCISGVWDTPVDLSINNINSVPILKGDSTSSFTAWTDLFSGELFICEYANTGAPNTPISISTETLNVNPSLSFSTAISLAAWEAIIGTDHVIQVSMEGVSPAALKVKSRWGGWKFW